MWMVVDVWCCMVGVCVVVMFCFGDDFKFVMGVDV